MTTPPPAPQPAAAPADFPGKQLGLVGLILAILVPLVGLIISVVANNQSKAAGFPNQLAKVGIIVGAILTALGAIAIIINIVIAVAAMSAYSY